MTIVELSHKGYEFRERSTRNFGAYVTLCYCSSLVEIFYAPSARFALHRARHRATAHFVESRLS